MASTYGLNVIKIGGIWIFQGGRSLSALKRPEGVLTIIESIWNYGNLAYLAANTYGLNVIEIGGIWIFRGGGQKPPISGGCMWPAMPIFELGLAIPVKSHVWKFGSDWLSLSRDHLNFPWGQKPPIRGVACDLQCPFSDLAELFQSKVICVNLVWIGWALQKLSCSQTFFYGAETPYRGGYMWPVMPIFELGRGCLDKSHVWKFGSDWLRLSRVIVGTNQMTRGCGRGQTFLKLNVEAPLSVRLINEYELIANLITLSYTQELYSVTLQKLPQ